MHPSGGDRTTNDEGQKIQNESGDTKASGLASQRALNSKHAVLVIAGKS